MDEETLAKFRDQDLKNPKTRDAVWKAARKVSHYEKDCPYCGFIQSKIKFVRPYSYYEGENNLLVTDVKERFEKIPDDDLEYLGLGVRPEDLILDTIPVLPITARPSITLESSDRSEDDLTHKLVDILRINQRLEENINSGAPQLIIEDLWDLLQYHIATYFDNGITGIPPARHRSGRPLKTLAQRLKGKEGRFRNNLSGKRVNFSARTVISPDAKISIDEVGVPYYVAMELTIPEEVTEWNLERMKQLVLNGPTIHPGAHSIMSQGRRKRIIDETREILAENLMPGDLIERSLEDGDIVLFNRQPSLHRASIMAHRVKVLPYNTFRLNTADCAPYNADFDGDEMNMHAPQSKEAMAEAEILMKVSKNIISPRYGKAIIGGRHDHVTGIYLLTRKEVKMDREEALMLSAEIFPLPKNKKTFTGKELFQELLPDDFNVTYKNKMCRKCDKCRKEKCRYEAYVKIEDGKLKSGVIENQGVSGTLVNKLFFDESPEAAKEYIDNVTKLSVNSLMKYGFSVGIDEEDIPDEAKTKLKDLLTGVEDTVNELIESYELGELKVIPGQSIEESLEDYIMRELGKSRSEAGQIAEEYAGETNNAVIMARSGARGSLLNLTQMSGCVGQQAVRGERIHRGYHFRTLSHYKKNDVSAEAGGFVRSNFKRGLRPTEYFFHSMGGREGLVDTAIRTGRSGYMQRRLINALQDLRVFGDGTVRGDGGMIVQYTYGEDGVDPSKAGYLEKYEAE